MISFHIHREKTSMMLVDSLHLHKEQAYLYLWVWYDMISFQIGNSHVELRPSGLGKGGILRPSVWLLNTRSWLILLPRLGFTWHLNVTHFDVTEEIRWVYLCMVKPAISSMSGYIFAETTHREKAIRALKGHVILAIFWLWWLQLWQKPWDTLWPCPLGHARPNVLCHARRARGERAGALQSLVWQGLRCGSVWDRYW